MQEGRNKGLRRILLPGLVILLVIVAVLSLRIGAVVISGRDIMNAFFGGPSSIGEENDIAKEIILSLRMPRIVLAVLVGASLALAGTVYQAVFRNPMADPYVIGASAGASCGATIAMVLPLVLNTYRTGTISIFAFINCLAAVKLVLSLAGVKKNQRTSMVNLILAGVAVSAVLSSLVSLLMFLLPDQGLHGLMYWLMGGFSGKNWTHSYLMLPGFVLGLGIIIFHYRELNAILLGEEEALGLGIDVHKVTKWLIAAASLLTASAVANAGIIGFIGLIVPHLMRMQLGPDHRYLIPNTCLMGALFMLVADTLARTIMAPIELPVGIITSLTGGPFFIYLLRKHRIKEW